MLPGSGICLRPPARASRLGTQQGSWCAALGVGARARAAARPGPDGLPASQDPGQAGAELAGRRSACPNLSGEEISPGRMEQRINPHESVAPNTLYEE